MRLPNPLQIGLGQGRVITGIVHDDGKNVHGIVFRDARGPHEPGANANHVLPDGPLSPQLGDVYLMCLTLDAANRLREDVDRVIASFNSAEEGTK